MKDQQPPEPRNVPLISVIVPIYNVEKYVRKCLESLRNQTLKQIEVIMIDDGSTDGSGRIAEEYVSDGWPRFGIVHHDCNRGLSSARNTGINAAVADWLMFVDSDDWVEAEFCEKPYEIAIANDADIVSFSAVDTTEKGRVKDNGSYNHSALRIMTHEQAIDSCGIAVWNKLYRRSLFDIIRFPEGLVYEEVATTHKLIYAAGKIIKTQEKLYFYRYRKNGISQNIANDDVLFNASKKRADELKRLGYPDEKAQTHLLSTALRCYGRAEDRNCQCFKESVAILQDVRNTPDAFSRNDKIKLKMWRMNKSLYRLMYWAARRAKR